MVALVSPGEAQRALREHPGIPNVSWGHPWRPKEPVGNDLGHPMDRNPMDSLGKLMHHLSAEEGNPGWSKVLKNVVQSSIFDLCAKWSEIVFFDTRSAPRAPFLS